MYCISKRYFILIALCSFSFGFMGVNDLPGSLQHAIMTLFNINEYEFSLLYSAAAWPSCFSFVYGLLIDRYIGVRAATFICVLILTVGNVLFLIGSFLQSYTLILIGRIFYGLGADPLSVCMSSYTIHWFSSSNQLGLVFAMISSSPWMGSSIVFFMSNRIYEYVLRNYPSMNALGIAVSSNLPFTFLIILSGFTLGLTYEDQPSDKHASDENNKADDKPTWKEILNFPILFWLVILLGTAYYLALMTFLMMSQESLAKRYNLSLDESSNLSSTFSFVTCLISPLLGFVSDKVGRNLIFTSMALLLGILGHGIMAYSTSYPYLPVLILSFSYSLMASSYKPLISFLVKKHQRNTAFGMVKSGMNGSFAYGTIIVGVIVTNYGYMAEEKFYFFLLLGTVPLWLFIWFLNFKQGNKLCLSAKQKAYYIAQINNNGEDNNHQAKTVNSGEGSNM